MLLHALAFLLAVCGLGTAGGGVRHVQEMIDVLGRAESASAESDLEHRKGLALADGSPRFSGMFVFNTVGLEPPGPKTQNKGPSHAE